MEQSSVIITVMIVVTFLASGQCVNIDGWTWSHKMDNVGIYQLRTDINLTSELVTFSVNLTKPLDSRPEFKQWIGIGLSKSESMGYADFVIGFHPDKFKDYFTLADGTLLEDRDQTPSNISDWTVIDEIQNAETFTFFMVRRSFKVNNATEDMEIKDEKVYLIWAHGIQNDLDQPDYDGNATIGYLQTNLLRPFPNSASVNIASFIHVTAIVLLALIKHIFVN